MNPPEPITAGPVVLAQSRQQLYTAGDGRRFAVTTGTLTFSDPAPLHALAAARAAGTLTLDMLRPRPPAPELRQQSLDVAADAESNTLHYHAVEVEVAPDLPPGHGGQ